MNKLCCVLNKSIHSSWKGDEQYFCTGCITDFIEKEYGELYRQHKRDDNSLGDRLRKDFKFLHPITSCPAVNHKI